MIAEEIQNGETSGTFSIVVFREDYNVTLEMEEYFCGEDQYEILVEWSLEIN